MRETQAAGGGLWEAVSERRSGREEARAPAARLCVEELAHLLDHLVARGGQDDALERALDEHPVAVPAVDFGVEGEEGDLAVPGRAVLYSARAASQSFCIAATTAAPDSGCDSTSVV